MSENNSAPKSTARRDKLRSFEIYSQNKWKTCKVNEAQGLYDEDQKKQPKFLVTFPYPYMNGRLHLGHAFSLTKAEFTARY